MDGQVDDNLASFRVILWTASLAYLMARIARSWAGVFFCSHFEHFPLISTISHIEHLASSLTHD